MEIEQRLIIAQDRVQELEELYTSTKADLDRMIDYSMAAEDEVKELKAAIKEHQSRNGDDKCFLNDLRLWSLVDPDIELDPVLPKDFFLGNCQKNYESQDCGKYVAQVYEVVIGEDGCGIYWTEEEAKNAAGELFPLYPDAKREICILYVFSTADDWIKSLRN